MWTVRSPVLALLTLALLSNTACRRLPRTLRARHQHVAPAAPTPKRLPPLVGVQSLENLMLPSFEPSVVVAPLGARYARPVAVVLHGQTDTAEANCQTWRTVTGASYFVLCPALRRQPLASDVASTPCTEWACAAEELKEALPALRKRFGAYVAPRQVMLVGSGRGASLAVPIAQQNPTVFPILWLINGGFESWSSSLSATYVERGGRLLGLVCTVPECQPEVVRIGASAHAIGLKIADYRSTRGEESGPALAVSLRATWEAAKPFETPWVLPGTAKPAHRVKAQVPPH